MLHRLAYCFLVAGLFTACTAADADTTPGDDDGDSAPAEPIEQPAASTGGHPHLEAFFQVPTVDGVNDKTLENKVIELADQATKDTTIRASMYDWSLVPVAQAFVRAKQRGADVKIIVDKEANVGDHGAASKTALDSALVVLHDGLGTDLIECTRGKGSCQGNGIDHNKFYTFSSLSDGSKDVVIQASANLAGSVLHNNMVISRGDPKLFDAYNSYWTDLSHKKLDLDYYKSVDGEHTIAYFFPRAEGDTIVSILDHVRCHASSKIRVTQAFFSSGRIAIADALVKLQKDGCDVQVEMRTEGPQDSQSVIDTLRHGHVKLFLYPSKGGANIHSKYLLVDSDYDGDAGVAHRKLVWTGSHNYLLSALRDNDETLLRVDDATVFADFLHNWNVIHDQIVSAE